MTINNENEFYKTIKTMLDENRITKEEHDALAAYVCGIFDALIFEEDLLM